MGSYQDANDKLRSRFEAQWPSLRPTVPVEMPNAPFSKPAGGPWARFTVLSDRSTEQLAAGPGSGERAFGTVQLEIFVPIADGNALGLLIADDFASIWRGNPIAGWWFWPTRTLELGRASDDPNYAKFDALTPFQREFQP